MPIPEEKRALARKNPNNVRINQVWMDARRERLLQVDRIVGAVAKVVNVNTGRATWIRLDRFSTREHLRLVKDAEPEVAAERPVNYYMGYGPVA